MKQILALTLALALAAALFVGCAKDADAAKKDEKLAKEFPGNYHVLTVDEKSPADYLQKYFTREQSVFDGDYDTWLEVFEISDEDVAKMADLELLSGGKFSLTYRVHPFDLIVGTWELDGSTLVLKAADDVTIKGEVKDGQIVFDGTLAYPGAKVVFGK